MLFFLQIAFRAVHTTFAPFLYLYHKTMSKPTLSIVSIFMFTLSFSLCWSNFLAAQSISTDFPWLDDLIEVEDCCTNNRVTQYLSGPFSFIYIEKEGVCLDEGNELYFQDGTFFCTEINDFDCLEAYGLTSDNAIVLWECNQIPPIDVTLSICQGDSVFLSAIQEFPIPPQGPTGPDGELPPTPCQPILNEIEINPTTASQVEGLTGFMVAPTESIIYTVTSRGFCGGPSSVNLAEASMTYEVIVEDICDTLERCEDILEQEWFIELTSSECTGNVYNIDFNGIPGVFVSSLCGCIDAPDVVFSCDGKELCLFGFVNPDVACDPAIFDQLIDENILWSPACDCPCPIDFSPVCGVDGNTYESVCAATCAGVEIESEGTCSVESACLALERFEIGPNLCERCISEVATYTFEGETYLVTFGDNINCSDGITTVTNCDSTVVFCFDGGIAGFSQCTQFFEEAIRLETLWSKDRDCLPQVAEPCTDLAGVDFGLCEALMGVGIVDGKCTFISGCLNTTVDGIDYAPALFPSVEICQQTCEGTIPPAIFEDFPWLFSLIDPAACESASVEVYDLGAFSFVFVQTNTGSALYFEDGSFYCEELPNNDCRALYGLTPLELTARWVCGQDQGNFIATKNILTTRTELSPSIKIFPNPTANFVQVFTPNLPTEKQLLSIFDLNGRLLQQQQIDGGNNTLDFTDYQAGIYLLEWLTDNDRKVIKVMKQ